ncbi:unnamed protein product [Phytomonas sp. EM1]|nr:unnamed protein product [Phytomonas sp. EM1]|eukprot:CCW64370.1 unnamed protein product [Phytomonas sp. isolate EM1]
MKNGTAVMQPVFVNQVRSHKYDVCVVCTVEVIHRCANNIFLRKYRDNIQNHIIINTECRPVTKTTHRGTGHGRQAVCGTTWSPVFNNFKI